MTEVIDAHHHFLDPSRVAYPFLRFLPDLERFVGPGDLAPRLAEAGVAGTVCVQAADSEDETDFMLEQAAESDFVRAVVGWVPLADPEATGRALAARSGEPRFRGVRHLIHDEPDDDWVVAPRVLESLGLLAEAGLSFDLSAFKPRHLEHVATLAERVPTLEVVVCHLGMPGVGPDDREPWARALALAAEHPRCHAKLSGLDLYRGGCDVEAFRPYVDHALAVFGAERLLWASNWPVSLQLRGYGELLETARRLIAGCGEREQEAILGGNAARVYRL